MSVQTPSTDPSQPSNCTPLSFIKGLWLLITTGIRENALPLAPLALGAVLCLLMQIPTVADHRVSMAEAAIASIAVLVGSISCVLLAYLRKSFRPAFLLAGLMLLLVYFIFAMMTASLAPTGMIYGDQFWKTAPALINAAILPMYLLLVLLQFVIVGGVLALTGWALFKLPRTAKIATRHICKMGQRSDSGR